MKGSDEWKTGKILRALPKLTKRWSLAEYRTENENPVCIN